ncbi:hypothetical protein GCM10027195_41460 [Comamonas sediminis]
MLGNHGQGRDMGRAFEFFAQGLGQIGHLVEIGCTALVDPAKKLRGPEALLSQPFAKGGQTSQIKIKQIGGHGYTLGPLTYATRPEGRAQVD